MDRDKLKENIAKAHFNARCGYPEGVNPFRALPPYERDEELRGAAAALTMIEDAGYADASAVWDQAVEACASAIKEVEKELAAQGEVYILLKTAEHMRSLKRSDKTESDNG